MTDTQGPAGASDPHNLDRFVQAQENVYEQALGEIRTGRKKSHWIWYIFPTFDGLWTSSRHMQYSIKSIAEAKAYLAHPILGPRLRECFEAVLGVEGRSASAIFGFTDAKKLRSCATLFAFVAPEEPVFERVLGNYYPGERADTTLRLLDMASGIT